MENAALFTLFSKSLFSLHFSCEGYTFSLLFYGNLYFLCSCLDCHFSSTFSLLFYCKLYFLCSMHVFHQACGRRPRDAAKSKKVYFLCTFQWKSLLVFTCLLKSPFSLYLGNEISTFSALFYGNVYSSVLVVWNLLHESHFICFDACRFSRVIYSPSTTCHCLDLRVLYMPSGHLSSNSWEFLLSLYFSNEILVFSPTA